MIIVPVSGKARAGKDFFSALLAMELENLGYYAQVIHYATAVKRDCRIKFCWNGEKDEAGRSLLQWYGTDVIRHEKPNHWVEEAGRHFAPNTDFVILPDTRFRNEIDYWRDKYPVVSIRLQRADNPESDLTDEQRKHRSETELDDYPFDHTLSIPHGIEHLEREAKRMARVLTDRTTKESAT